MRQIFSTFLEPPKYSQNRNITECSVLYDPIVSEEICLDDPSSERFWPFRFQKLFFLLSKLSLVMTDLGNRRASNSVLGAAHHKGGTFLLPWSIHNIASYKILPVACWVNGFGFNMAQETSKTLPIPVQNHRYYGSSEVPVAGSICAWKIKVPEKCTGNS